MMRLFLIYKSKHLFMRIYLTFIRGEEKMDCGFNVPPSEQFMLYKADFSKVTQLGERSCSDFVPMCEEPD